MGRIKIPSLISLIILVSCSNSQEKIVSFSNIENSKSNLLGKLLTLRDFDANWKIKYEEVTQTLGQKDNFHSDEYANYWIFAEYIPLNTSYTISQSLYKYDYKSIEDLNKFVFFDNNQFRDIQTIKINELPEIAAKCGAYTDLNKQDCLYALQINNIAIALRVHAPKEQSRDELSKILLPIIKNIELKFQSK